MSNDSIPTVEQSCALARLARRGELTTEHRGLIARLLDEVASATRVAAQAAEHYPDAPEWQATFKAAAWRPVGTGYARLIEAVSPAATSAASSLR